MANQKDVRLTLSSAILSPLNSLFEAQVQSARSFLSFILQLGFKENVSQEDIDAERKKLEENYYDQSDAELSEAKRKLNRLEELVKQKIRYKELERRKDLSEDEKAEFEKISEDLEKADMKDDLYTMRFKYQDGQGIERSIEVPALALVPVQPLAIQSASFDFSMSVEEQTQTQITKQKSRAIKSSPWEFIHPRRISGKIQSEDNAGHSSKSGIKIRVEVGPAPMPQGLSNVLTSLTQSARIVNNNQSKS